MVATLGAAQRKDGLTTLDVTLINCSYQLLALDRVKWRNAIKPSGHVAELLGKKRTLNWIVSNTKLFLICYL